MQYAILNRPWLAPYHQWQFNNVISANGLGQFATRIEALMQVNLPLPIMLEIL